MKISLVRTPSAWVPVALALAALGVVLVHIALFGTAREADEGASAHLWQLLMAAQIPLIPFFAIKWLPQAPREALVILGVQLVTAVAAMAPVFLLGL